MLSLDLDQIDEQALLSLEANQIPESLRIEYKRELSLSSPSEKRETAKDISALANTAGGRIVYGLDEKTLPDGSKVAGPIRPLSDGTLDSRLADIIVATIHPRPRFRIAKVPVDGGFVLIVEVYDSFGRDLHLVTGYGDGRFYRRHDQGTFPMTEPEIREAYLRIAASRVDLESTIEKLIDAEISRRATARESLLIVPWYGSPNLIAPREISHFRQWLESGPLAASFMQHYRYHLTVMSTGFHAATSHREAPIDSSHYFAAHKSGLIHLSSMLFNGDDHHCFNALQVLERFLVLLQMAAELYSRASYWGPVRIHHVMRFPRPFALIGNDDPLFSETGTIAAGEYRHTVYEVRLREIGHHYGVAAKELLDQVFNAVGVAECPWLDQLGKPTPQFQAVLASSPNSSARMLIE